jgi:hypothetical protein
VHPSRQEPPIIPARIRPPALDFPSEALLTSEALQRVMLNSLNFSSTASTASTAKGVIQIFNVGGARARICGGRRALRSEPRR